MLSFDNGETCEHETQYSTTVKSRCSAAMQSECTSDSDISRQSVSPKFSLRHRESSELSLGEGVSSPKNRRLAKLFRKMRPSSAPRSLVADMNICNSRDFNLPTYSVTDFRRTPAMYIEQDIINKQRQEIQLLMEELGNRDQELTDLVLSHQKQVKVWEIDSEKLKAVQAKLTACEEELRSRELQLKSTILETAQLNEQREVDAMELKRTQDEMIKLAERIMENSVYIKDMESQNQKLSLSLRDFVSARQAFTTREQELLSLLEDKESQLADRQQEVEKLTEHIKFLECQCQELGERNNNMSAESVNWKKKYSQVKEEVDRLNNECKSKEDNIQKMTQQLHESLQQAIALQKALFTSCEREKCKEEVMYSLRKQHKRTMQELQNIRELYDRLSHDTTLYHLSVKDREVMGDGRKKEEELMEEADKKKKSSGKIDEELEKWHLDNRRKIDTNMSSLKGKQENSEESFLVKEMKDKKPASREEQTVGMNGEKCASSNAKTDEVRSHDSGFESSSHRLPSSLISSVVKSDQMSAKAVHTTMCRNAATITSSTTMFSDEARPGFPKRGSHTEAGYGQIPVPGFGNTSRNADIRGSSRSSSISRAGAGKSLRSQTTSPINHQDVLHGPDILSKSVDGKRSKDGDGGGESSSDASPSSRFDSDLPPADGDGVSHQPKGDTLRKSCDQAERQVPMKETKVAEPNISRTGLNSAAMPKKSSILKKDRDERKMSFSTDDEMTSKQFSWKRVVGFDSQEDVSKSHTTETEDSELTFRSPVSSDEKHISSARDFYCHGKCLQPPVREDNQCESFSPERVERKAFLGESETLANESYPPQKGRGRHQLSENCANLDPVSLEKTHKSDFHEGHAKLKIQNLEEYEVHLSPVSCDLCRSRGKSCDCFRSSGPPLAEKGTSPIQQLVPRSGKSYPTLRDSVCTTKFSMREIDSLLEYSCALNDSQLHQAARQAVPPAECNNIALNLSSHKSYLSAPPYESFSSHKSASNHCHKSSCEDLPDEVSTYLSRQRPVRREMYYNNNNKSTSNQTSTELESCFKVSEREPEAVRKNGSGTSQCGGWDKAASNQKREYDRSTVQSSGSCRVSKDVRDEQWHKQKPKKEVAFVDATNNNNKQAPVLSNCCEFGDVKGSNSAKPDPRHLICQVSQESAAVKRAVCHSQGRFEMTRRSFLDGYFSLRTGIHGQKVAEECIPGQKVTEESYFCPEDSDCDTDRSQGSPCGNKAEKAKVSVSASGRQHLFRTIKRSLFARRPSHFRYTEQTQVCAWSTHKSELQSENTSDASLPVLSFAGNCSQPDQLCRDSSRVMFGAAQSGANNPADLDVCNSGGVSSHYTGDDEESNHSSQRSDTGLHPSHADEGTVPNMGPRTNKCLAVDCNNNNHVSHDHASILCLQKVTSVDGVTQPETQQKVTSVDGVTQPETQQKVTSVDGVTQPETQQKVTSVDGVTQPETQQKVTSVDGVTQPETQQKVTSVDGVTQPESERSEVK